MTARGMSTESDRQRDRDSWAQSVAKRNTLIAELKAYNVKVDSPHCMKLRDLEELLDGIKRVEQKL